MKKNKISRRSFLFLTGATGVGGMMFTHGMDRMQNLVPYVNPPDYPKPGDWAFYSTTCRECPAGCGMVMWHRDGRVTKAEGNPFHPINRGKLCIRGQSSVQGEYNSGRITRVLNTDKRSGAIHESNWEEAFDAIKKNLSALKPILISDLQTGSLSGVMEDFASQYDTKPYYYEAFNYETLKQAAEEIYGTDVIPRFNINGSDLILSFNADFLQTWLSPVEYTVDFSKIHSPDKEILGTFIYFGPAETMTAVNADQFIITRPGSEAAIIFEIAVNLQKKGGIKNKNIEGIFQSIPLLGNTVLDPKILDELTDKIIKAKAPVVLAGRPEDKSLDGINTAKAAYCLNELLDNGKRIDFSQNHALSRTVSQREIRNVFHSITKENLLILHNINPVYDQPGIEDYIKGAGAVIYIGPQENETSAFADWILPSNYPLEDWGDYEPWKGTVSLLQPVMRPLFDFRSAGEIFLRLRKIPVKESYKDIVLGNWKKWIFEKNPDLQESAVMDSLDESMRRSHLSRKVAELNSKFSQLNIKEKEAKEETSGFILNVVPSLFFYDGRLSNRSWLQEIPDPVTGIVWQSWMDMNSGTAAEMNIKDGEVVRVLSTSAKCEVPVRLTTHISERTVSLQTGQGHWNMGEIADKVGVNVFLLSNREYPLLQMTVKIEKTGKFNIPLYLNNRGDQYDRDLLKWVHQNQLVSKEEIIMPLPDGYSKEHDLYRPHEHKEHRWAMVIDLQSCIGCKACEAACYAENNVSTVGRANCAKGLEMSWLKVPAYNIENGRIAFMPLPCQHCDAAPCEPVCPVYASSHTDEGLNAQIYNRCVGTRYCSNNCPYKVRRFNWKNNTYNDINRLQLNPEVTVRCRGVMEKCTFCVQRIRYVEYVAKRNERKIEDGEIVPACAQTCPTNAIIFGDLLDNNSQVSRLFNHQRRYQLLQELNTKPAVVYLKKIIL